MSLLDHTITSLAMFRSLGVFNPWGETDPLDTDAEAAGWRCGRLRSHFDRQAQFLLIGEAPGYAGCRFSGIPFTNEKLLLDGVVPGVAIPGRITTRDLPWSEPSATIVWRTLYALGIAQRTVMWNAFPWHPHKLAEPYSNRAPTRSELAAGQQDLLSVLALFMGAQIVAVGNIAARALSELGVVGFVKVRHPANGGATLFRSGLEALVRREA